MNDKKALLESLSINSRLLKTNLIAHSCKVSEQNRHALESELLLLGTNQDYDLEIQDDALRDALNLILKKLDAIQNTLNLAHLRELAPLPDTFFITHLGHYALFLKDEILESNSEYYLRFELSLDKVMAISILCIAINKSALKIVKCSNQDALDAYIAKCELAAITKLKRS